MPRKGEGPAEFDHEARAIDRKAGNGQNGLHEKKILHRHDVGGAGSPVPAQAIP